MNHCQSYNLCLRLFCSLLHYYVCMFVCTVAECPVDCFTSPRSVLPAAAFTADPQNATALLEDQAIFRCSFENIDVFPTWDDTDRGTFTTSDTTGDVRYIQDNNMTVSLNVTATLARDGVCYFCVASLLSGSIQSGQGCLTVAGKWSMRI